MAEMEKEKLHRLFLVHLRESKRFSASTLPHRVLRPVAKELAFYLRRVCFYPQIVFCEDSHPPTFFHAHAPFRRLCSGVVLGDD